MRLKGQKGHIRPFEIVSFVTPSGVEIDEDYRTARSSKTGRIVNLSPTEVLVVKYDREGRREREGVHARLTEAGFKIRKNTISAVRNRFRKKVEGE